MEPQPPNDRFRSRIRKSTCKLAYWTAAWLLTTAVLAFGPRLFWNEDLAITYIALGINVLVGVGMIVVNTNHLKDLDELQRKVTLDAMGITLGVTFVVGIPWSLLDAYDVITFDARFEHSSFSWA